MKKNPKKIASNYDAHTIYELLREKGLIETTKPCHQALDLNSHLEFRLIGINRIRIKQIKNHFKST